MIEKRPYELIFPIFTDSNSLRKGIRDTFGGRPSLTYMLQIVVPIIDVEARIRILEQENNRRGDLFGRFVAGLFVSGGYSYPRLNIHKSGRENDLTADHRLEPRRAPRKQYSQLTFVYSKQYRIFKIPSDVAKIAIVRGR